MLEEKEDEINDENKIAENSDYLEALNSYYKIKFNYENEFNKDKNKILKNETLSWKEKEENLILLKRNVLIVNVQLEQYFQILMMIKNLHVF